MNFRPLFVTGMFRSGTTLVARMLNAHPQIALASDPLLPLLKHLRDEVASEIFGDGAPAPQAPLGDYFADADALTLRRSVRDATLDRPLSSAGRRALRPLLETHAQAFSGRLVNRLEALRGETYREFYVDMLHVIREVYGCGSETYVGHKEVWATEFTPVLHRAFPELRSIHVIRDPRAVCASKNVDPDKYPWLFLIRQWRKLSGLAWLAAHENAHREQVLRVRYEDLVSDPVGIGTRICAFLEIPFAAAMVDPTHLRDGDDRPWRRNSSYADLAGECAITDKGADRWRHLLTADEITLVESLTYPLMNLFGYACTTDPSTRLSDALMLRPPEVASDELTEWIRDHVRVDPVSTAVQMSAESLRLRMLEAPCGLGDDLVESMFLSRRLYDACCKHARDTGAANPRTSGLVGQTV